MRVISALFAFFLLLLPSPSRADDLGRMRLSLIDGAVQVLIQDSTDWTDAAINVPLNEGDRLWVPDGARAEVQARGGVFVRMDGGTALDILSSSEEAAQFYLDRGHAYVNNRRGGIRAVQVDTPLSSVRSYDNSVLMIDVTEDGVTEVSVLKGYITAESRAGATRVGAGNTLTIRGDRDAELSPIGAPDAWEQWNTARDRDVTAWGESARYLPDELHEYSGDFDSNGRWDFVSTYGYVWVPTVTVVNWAPYSFGQWVWIRGSYVWVSYDPWGWAPYHYGRWAFIGGRGWCWVPPAAGAVYWGPGYVGWIVTPASVAWVPLAPGELYYGYGYYGPWSVNINTVNINTVTVNQTYVNARHDHAVHVEKRDRFGTGRQDRDGDGGNPFIDNRLRGRDVTVVPPPVKPKEPIVILPPERRGGGGQRPPDRDNERRALGGKEQRPATPETGLGRGTRGPEIMQRPPERVTKNRPQELKNERRMVRERDASVFRPHAPENLPVKRSNEPRVVPRPPQQQRPATGGKQAGEQKKEQQKERHEGK